MKNLFLSFAIITSLLTVSCKKENAVKPTSPAKAINVEYRISSETSNLNIVYQYPDASGRLVSTQMAVNRTPLVISFSTNKGSFLSVQASNVNTSNKIVNVQIFVDGVLFQEATSIPPSQKAVASGSY